MHQKPSLSFYTNIPTPYQLSFFRELAKHFQLRVIFYSITENNRTWDFSLEEEAFEVVVLKNNIIARFLQKWVVDYHFSWSIFSTVLQDNSQSVIVGGSYWVPNALVAILLSKLRSKKVAFYSEPLFEVKTKAKFLLKWLLLRVVHFGCDYLFCVGRKAAASFTHYGVGIPKYIIPYNIDHTVFENLDQFKIRDYKLRYKNNNEIIVLSSGALIHRKGMDILIKAVRQIPHPDLRLLLVGEGPERESLQALCGDDPRVSFLGFQPPDELPYFFALADIFAFASRYDGWAVVINEAIAAKVPIVSSNKVGAALELITSADLGYLCESDQVEDFKMALEELVFSKAKREKVSACSSRLVKIVSSEYNASLVQRILAGEGCYGSSPEIL